MQFDSAVLFFECDNDDVTVTNAVSFSNIGEKVYKSQLQLIYSTKHHIFVYYFRKVSYRSCYFLSFYYHQSLVLHMRLNFVVESVYYWCLVAEVRLLLDISAPDIWLVYLLMIVVAVV